MCAFSFPGRIAVKNKSPFKIWFDDVDHCLVNNAVLDCGLMNLPALGIVNDKCLVRVMSVCPLSQLFLQREQVILKMSLECLNVRL